MPFITRQNSKPGDHVELLALIDVLALPNVCGADIMKASNFSIKPVRLSIDTAGDTAEYALLQKVKRRELYGDDDGAALRDIVFSWREDNYMGK